jgi:uncharacterized protein YbjT (DUF2867 family)
MTLKTLVLGANGFIGSTIVARLLQDGHDVSGLGRNLKQARLKMPMVNWLQCDLATMTGEDAWKELIASHDVVVNCAGALQDGLADDLTGTQEKSMLALYRAASAEGSIRIVQVSARTDGDSETLPFLTTKRRADDALAASGLDYVIVRPALVIGRNAHGGTALVRALASFPFTLPLLHASSPVQTISVDDVAEVVATAANGDIPAGSDLNLASAHEMTLSNLVQLHRQWLGLVPVPVIEVAPALVRPVTRLADIAGKLGWRSPMRSTAMKVMSGGVTSNGRNATVAGLCLQSAEHVLAAHPSGVQDLWFARLYLLKPFIIGSLSLFWILSGLIPLLQLSQAAAHFLPFVSLSMALTITIATCAMDIGLGFCVLVRPLAKKALIGMLAVTAVYLVGATVLEPELWLDPLGPLVKVLPSIILALVALATLDER